MVDVLTGGKYGEKYNIYTLGEIQERISLIGAAPNWRGFGGDKLVQVFWRTGMETIGAWTKAEESDRPEDLKIARKIAQLIGISDSELGDILLCSLQQLHGHKQNRVLLPPRWNIIINCFSQTPEEQRQMKKNLLKSVWEARFDENLSVEERQRILSLCKENGFDELVEEIQGERFDKNFLEKKRQEAQTLRWGTAQRQKKAQLDAAKAKLAKLRKIH